MLKSVCTFKVVYEIYFTPQTIHSVYTDSVGSAVLGGHHLLCGQLFLLCVCSVIFSKGQVAHKSLPTQGGQHHVASSRSPFSLRAPTSPT